MNVEYELVARRDHVCELDQVIRRQGEPICRTCTEGIYLDALDLAGRLYEIWRSQMQPVNPAVRLHLWERAAEAERDAWIAVAQEVVATCR